MWGGSNQGNPLVSRMMLNWRNKVNPKGINGDDIHPVVGPPIVTY